MARFVTAHEIGERYGVRAATVKAWAREGRIPSIRITGKIVRFDPDAVDRVLQETVAPRKEGGSHGR
ncbi:MAG: helix-turn-helix domain-containing protein [Planctomycetes bacterium]|nr:helix-turn-helix domain-containing protein [Planctomycetota bacterium]